MKTTEDEQVAISGPATFHFPVGYHQLHADPFLDFELNRPFGQVGDETMLAELRSIAPKIHTLADRAREYLLYAGWRGLTRHHIPAQLVFQTHPQDGQKLVADRSPGDAHLWRSGSFLNDARGGDSRNATGRLRHRG